MSIPPKTAVVPPNRVGFVFGISRLVDCQAAKQPKLVDGLHFANTVLAVGEIDDLTAAIRAFADARDWAQFHTIRNLVLALTGEVGELAAEIQEINSRR